MPVRRGLLWSMPATASCQRLPLVVLVPCADAGRADCRSLLPRGALVPAGSEGNPGCALLPAPR
eukprot:5704706-Alexandrium_andersonii.AAC.1